VITVLTVCTILCFVLSQFCCFMNCVCRDRRGEALWLIGWIPLGLLGLVLIFPMNHITPNGFGAFGAQWLTWLVWYIIAWFACIPLMIVLGTPFANRHRTRTARRQRIQQLRAKS